MALMLTKKDLADKFAQEMNVSKKDAARYVQYVFDQMAETLIGEGTVDIKGFGKFTISERAARTGINPATKEQIQIAASKSVKFKASKGLKDAVNE
ncbi:HU family DNA-binding protein [Dubosiella muris]|uniref:HU family DNA-binding protein n=1 Tax=Dubosiella muris TaxID=3038133 RepID=A0AC61R8P7_9FIRM|nr:HU family DNA-binding protein [Dubosiella muris]TGY66686.1 HU family DNA-binding protein [Dubosiella muris]